MSTKNWFLPENTDLLGMLQAQAAITVEGMDALVEWAAGDDDAGQRVRDCEHRADDAKRALWRCLRDAFSPAARRRRRVLAVGRSRRGAERGARTSCARWK